MTRRALFFVQFLLLIFIAMLNAQEVKTTANGQHVLQLTDGQRAAVDSFLRAHPDMLQANCEALGLNSAACADSYQEWHQIVESTHAIPQSPYAAWGNYSHHQSPDLVIPFFSKTAVNNWGWRRWDIVVFEPVGPDRYKPIIALTDSWGVCFDGVLFHPVRKRVEFWCKSMGGDIRWNGTTFVGKLAKGD